MPETEENRKDKWNEELAKSFMALANIVLAALVVGQLVSPAGIRWGYWLGGLLAAIATYTASYLTWRK